MNDCIHIEFPDGRYFRLTAKNEKRLKKYLLSEYDPEADVKIWETGETLKLNDIFEV